MANKPTFSSIVVEATDPILGGGVGQRSIFRHVLLPMSCGGSEDAIETSHYGISVQNHTGVAEHLCPN